ncbi:carbohydrate kinase family protein [Blastococcus sp. Marseille-P5729]|uniref:carbohydrate kinase family protein n=1 Tax=Blastococcus sp. Marseille-P5729 TaxID=2086582 RepID=UPI001F1E6D91|nr:carbohydrate kinase family protein [Blastococcus sp. Marseille-P5729]
MPNFEPSERAIRDFGALQAKDGQQAVVQSPRVMIDPLSSVRRPGDPFVDVFCAGQVFFDIVFTGLAEMPRLGTEEWAPGMGSSPGGMANMAVAMRRLGLRTWLAAAFGDDMYGDYCWDTLGGQEDIDLSASRRFDGWHSPVTVSMALERDRTMITHGHPAPQALDQMIGSPPASRACFAALELEEQRWVRHAYDSGALVFADLSWDTSQAWSQQMIERLRDCHVFLPNAVEAMVLSRTDSPERAAAALAEHVPVIVVTRGRNGAYAIDQRTGETADIPGIHVDAIDPTGAGDVFGAGFMVGTLAGWQLGDRLRFANLCAALSVQHFGGSLAAPGWGEISSWYQHNIEAGSGGEQLGEYGFLADILPSIALGPVRRAGATIGLRRRT